MNFVELAFEHFVCLNTYLKNTFQIDHFLKENDLSQNTKIIVTYMNIFDLLLYV